MKFQVQLDKVIPQCEEKMTVMIRGNNNQAVDISFESLGIAIEFITKFFDDRLEILNTMIVEDASFLEYFSEEEKEQFQKAFNALYHNTSLAYTPDEIKKYLQIQLSKGTAPGEAITIVLSHFGHMEYIAPAISKAFDLIDSRLSKANERATSYNEIFTSFPMGTQMKFQQVFDALFGRVSPDVVVGRLHGDRVEKEERAKEAVYLNGSNNALDSIGQEDLKLKDINASQY